MSDIEPTESSPDPLDDLLRRTMRALDAQTPPRTFDSLPLAVDQAIDQAAASGDLSDALVEEAGGGGVAEPRRGRRSSMSEMRAKKATTIPPPIAVEEAPAAPVLESPRSRAHRRSLLETQVGAPHPWWQSRMLAGAVLAAAVAIAAVLVVTRGGEDKAELSGSSKTMVRSMNRPAEPLALTPEQVQLRQVLAPVLPMLRACAPSRLVDGVALRISLNREGAMGEVSVDGELSKAERACVADVMQGTALGLMPASAGKTIAIPLFD